MSALDHVVEEGLKEAKEIHTDEDWINLSLIMTNMVSESMLKNLDTYMNSLLGHAAKELHLKLIIISDLKLAGVLRPHLKE